MTRICEYIKNMKRNLRKPVMDCILYRVKLTYFLGLSRHQKLRKLAQKRYLRAIGQ